VLMHACRVGYWTRSSRQAGRDSAASVPIISRHTCFYAGRGHQ